MATLTITHADGSTETFNVDRAKFTGVRNMTVDGETVSVDHTVQPDTRTLSLNGESITLERPAAPADIRTITLNGEQVTINRGPATSTPIITTITAGDFYRTVSGGFVYQPDGTSRYSTPTS